MIHFFISYDRDDLDRVNRLGNLLGSQGFKLWLDRTGLPPGTTDWQNKIEDAIENADALIVVLSPNAKESKWVRMEAKYAEMLGKQIIPVLVLGDGRTSVPIELVNTQWLDYRIESKEQADNLISALRNIVSAVTRKRSVEDIMRELARVRENPRNRPQVIGLTSIQPHFWAQTQTVVGYKALIQVFFGNASASTIKDGTPLNNLKQVVLTPEHQAYLNEKGWDKTDLGGFANTYSYSRIWELWSYAVDVFPRDKSVDDAKVAEQLVRLHEYLGVDIDDCLNATLEHRLRRIVQDSTQ